MDRDCVIRGTPFALTENKSLGWPDKVAARPRGGPRPAGTGRKVLLDHLPRHRCVVEPPAAERTPHGNDLVARVSEDLAVVGTYLIPQVDRQLPVEPESFFHLPEQLLCLVDRLEYGLAEFGWQHAVLALDFHQPGDRLVG